MHVRLPKLSRRLVATAVPILVILLGSSSLITHYFTSSRIKISNAITDTVAFPIYLPKNLPEGYTINVDSFKNITGEGEGVLVFQANDTAGDSLAISEQRKPANFNFDQFNARQMVNPKKLPDVPYPTTAGKTLDRQTTFLSIVTDRTWIIITTQAELNNLQLHDIAAGIAEY